MESIGMLFPGESHNETEKELARGALGGVEPWSASGGQVCSDCRSWTFIIIQSVLLAIWVMLNLIAYMQHWDPYPFILLNLVLSFQAAYASPIIMMSQNRQGERDRIQAQHDYETNVAAKEEIELLMKNLSALEAQKIDKLIEGMNMLIRDRAAKVPGHPGAAALSPSGSVG